MCEEHACVCAQYTHACATARVRAGARVRISESVCLESVSVLARVHDRAFVRATAGLAAATVAGTVHLFLLPSGELRHVYSSVHLGGLRSLSWGADSSVFVTAGRDKVARIWRVPS